VTSWAPKAEHLIEEGYTKPEVLAMEGRSAGGLLMGAVLNIRPDLFNVALAGVPFVDVMNTMCDPSIPLTTGEWEEWGSKFCTLLAWIFYRMHARVSCVYVSCEFRNIFNIQVFC